MMKVFDGSSGGLISSINVVSTVMTTRKLLLLSSFVILFSTQTVVVYGQESPNPTIQLPNQFDTTLDFRSNVCERQHQYHEGQIVNLEDGLEGIELQTFMVVGPYFRLDQDSKVSEDYPGLYAVLLDELAKRGKFSWRNSFATSLIEAPIEGKTWTELLMWSVNTYDISAEWWVRTAQRISLGVDYPEGWYDASYVLVGMKQDEEASQGGEEVFNPWSWLSPFDYGVWALIMLTIIFSGLIYNFLEYIDPYSDKQRLKNKPLETIYLSAMGFAGHMEFEARTQPARIFTFSLAMWSLLMAAAYTANLASFLVVKNSVPQIQIDSIEDVIRQQLPICVYKSSASHNELIREYPEAVVVEKALEEDTFKGIINGQCTVALASLASWQNWERNPDVNEGCQLEWIGRKYKNRPAGFATLTDSRTKCTSFISDVINVHMLRMKEEGFIQKAWEQYLSRSTASSDCKSSSGTTTSDHENGGGRQRRHLKAAAARNAAGAQAASGSQLENQRLNVKNMGGIFLMHGVFSMIAIVSALIMRCVGMTAKRNKKLAEKNLRRHLKRVASTRRLNCAVDDDNSMEIRKAYLKLLTRETAAENDTSTDDDGVGVPFDAASISGAGRLSSTLYSNSFNDNTMSNNNNYHNDNNITLTMNPSTIKHNFDSLHARQDQQIESMDELKKQVAALTSMLGHCTSFADGSHTANDNVGGGIDMQDETLTIGTADLSNDDEFVLHLDCDRV